MTVVRLASCYSQISRDLQRGIRGWKGFSFVAQQIWSEAMAPANKNKSVSVERKGLKLRASGAEQRMIIFCSSISHAKAETYNRGSQSRRDRPASRESEHSDENWYYH
jgi:hypothetical protein